MIHVCFGLHDKTGRYSKFTGTAMLSLFDNTSPKNSITVHIFHDNTLTQDNRNKFLYIASRYGQCVKFYNVEELCAEQIEKYTKMIPNARTSKVGIGSFYRLLISKFLPEDIGKILYIDSDVIVNLDINELYQIDLGEKIFACVPEALNGVDTQKILPLCYEGYVNKDDYFNAGILLMNLKRFRQEQEFVEAGIKFRSEHLYYFCFDQDILNYCFSTQTLHLPNKFNFFVREARKRNEVKIDQQIYHYLSSSGGQGILLNQNDPYNRLWMKYFVKTPWFNEATIGRLYEVFERSYRILNSEMKNSMIKLSSIMSGKTRVFFFISENLDALKKLFSIRDDEEIFLADDDNALENLLHTLWKSEGKKIAFILVPNFPAMSEALEKMELVQNEDFLNALEFLPLDNESILNSYTLIKYM